MRRRGAVPDAHSGIGLGLCQMISERSHQPSSWSAMATRAGMSIRSFGLIRYSEWRKIGTDLRCRFS